MAATTGRAVLSPAAVVGGAVENPSAEPVFTFRALPESRVRDRWTVGDSGSPAVAGVVSARPPSRFGCFGPMFRMRTGAGGAAGDAVVLGAGVPVPVPAPVLVCVCVRVWGRSPSTARCTGER
ncbi:MULTISPECIES: hypothetical protein [unclassified Streptomyces]|uniref:hypothetical protein n=1 Tax=unclassified Streptomyces TaxID=2593676 RepID=UPI0034500604